MNLNDYEIAVYVALRSIYDSQKGLQYITHNSIVFELYHTLFQVWYIIEIFHKHNLPSKKCKALITE